MKKAIDRSPLFSPQSRKEILALIGAFAYKIHHVTTDNQFGGRAMNPSAENEKPHYRVEKFDAVKPALIKLFRGSTELTPEEIKGIVSILEDEFFQTNFYEFIRYFVGLKRHRSNYESSDGIPLSLSFFSPKSIDFRHGQLYLTQRDIVWYIISRLKAQSNISQYEDNLAEGWHIGLSYYLDSLGIDTQSGLVKLKTCAQGEHMIKHTDFVKRSYTISINGRNIGVSVTYDDGDYDMCYTDSLTGINVIPRLNGTRVSFVPGINKRFYVYPGSRVMFDYLHHNIETIGILNPETGEVVRTIFSSKSIGYLTFSEDEKNNPS